MASRRVARAEPRPAASVWRCGARLHHLHVGVGEAAPEEALDDAERARVVERVQGLARPRSTVSRSRREEAQVELAGDRRRLGPLCDSTNLDALKSLTTSRRPTFSTFSSKAVSVPRRAESDQ